MLEYIHKVLEPGVHGIYVVDMFLPPIGVFAGDYSKCPSVILSDNQFMRYSEWQANRKNYLIQDMLPDISVDERNILVKGV